MDKWTSGGEIVGASAKKWACTRERKSKVHFIVMGPKVVAVKWREHSSSFGSRYVHTKVPHALDGRDWGDVINNNDTLRALHVVL